MKKAIKIGLGIAGCICTLVLGLILFLRVTEYRPKKEEAVSVEGKGSKKLEKGEEISVMTYNIGYGALSKTEDFFMDGGKHVQPDEKELVEENIQGIKAQIEQEAPDVVFLQEADRNSKRSYKIDEVKELFDAFGNTMAYAPNFKCEFIPYPWPPIGKVDGGVATLNQFEVTEAERIALPSSFSWPVSMCQLKRCLLVERAAIEGTDKEMVFVNLHLEAYDSGEGKIRQTKILADLLNKEYEKGNYVIAGGDFNQYFSCVDRSKYPVKNTEYFEAGKLPEEYFKGDWQIVMDDTTPTSRLLNEPYDPESEDTQYYMLDGFIVSPNIKIKELKTLDYDFTYTDHNPVKIKIELQ